MFVLVAPGAILATFVLAHAASFHNKAFATMVYRTRAAGVAPSISASRLHPQVRVASWPHQSPIRSRPDRCPAVPRDNQLGLSLAGHVQFPVCRFSPRSNDKVPCCRRRKRCERKSYQCVVPVRLMAYLAHLFLAALSNNVAPQRKHHIPRLPIMRCAYRSIIQSFVWQCPCHTRLVKEQSTCQKPTKQRFAA